MQRGEHLQAYDMAMLLLEGGAPSIFLAHAAVLCLARAGAIDHARREYVRLGLADAPDDHAAATLGARLLKDVALSTAGPRRRAFAKASADRYAAVWSRHQDLYSAVNVATMRLLAGEGEASRAFAEIVLASPPAATTADAAYYDSASRAEASVLLGRTEAAHDLMAHAIAQAPGSFVAHASTLRQLETIQRETGAAMEWLDAFRPPASAHFTGHIFAEGDGPTPGDIGAMSLAMRRAITEARVGFGYGALAAGGDILWAEALLDAGAELHVVLPTPTASFLETSVRPFGEGWTRRFEACLARAQSLRLAGRDPYAGDDRVFVYSSQYAIGCAVLRAQSLETQAVQLALWDGKGGEANVGVGSDVTYWTRTGRRPLVTPFDFPRGARPAQTTPAGRRAMKAMLFIDVRGFSALRDDQAPAFFDAVMTQIARTLEGLASPAEHVETWGDGVFLVFAEPVHAAEAALALLEAHRRLNLPSYDLPRGLGLRIGGHYGPVHLRDNPILRTPAVVGAHVVVAARIEPNVAPGSACVSEALAGVLTTFHGDRFVCGYVGRTASRRDFPPTPIFHLSRRH
jgi:class 3 adenylate cyclase